MHFTRFSSVLPMTLQNAALLSFRRAENYVHAAKNNSSLPTQVKVDLWERAAELYEECGMWDTNAVYCKRHAAAVLMGLEA